MSNEILLHQKVNLTTLEMRVLDYAISIAFDDKNDYCKAEISSETLTKFFGSNTRLANDSITRLTQKIKDCIVYSTETNKGMTVVNELSFSNGTLRISPNPELKPYYKRMLAYADTTLTSRYAYMLYGIIRNRMHEENTEYLDYTISVSELQNKMALVSLPASEISGDDIFLEVLKQDSSPAYKKFNDFKVKALEPAVTEINEKTDVFVSYSLIKTGVPVTGIQFTCRKKKVSQAARLFRYYQLSYEKLLNKAMPELSEETLTKLLAEAGNNINKVFDAYIDWKNTDSKDPVSFMIERIKS